MKNQRRITRPGLPSITLYRRLLWSRFGDAALLPTFPEVFAKHSDLFPDRAARAEQLISRAFHSEGIQVFEELGDCAKAIRDFGKAAHDEDRLKIIQRYHDLCLELGRNPTLTEMTKDKNRTIRRTLSELALPLTDGNHIRKLRGIHRPLQERFEYELDQGTFVEECAARIGNPEGELKDACLDDLVEWLAGPVSSLWSTRWCDSVPVIQVLEERIRRDFPDPAYQEELRSILWMLLKLGFSLERVLFDLPPEATGCLPQVPKDLVTRIEGLAEKLGRMPGFTETFFQIRDDLGNDLCVSLGLSPGELLAWHAMRQALTNCGSRGSLQCLANAYPPLGDLLPMIEPAWKRKWAYAIWDSM